jgi:non-haem Fe2+, alpha-ketoglutarate-dependent halogenase
MASTGLSALALAQYHRDGFHFPIRAISAAEARDCRAKLERFEAGRPLAGGYRHKSHLLFTWCWDLIHNDAVLDAVESVIGPDILCWSTTFFIKEAGDPAYVSWHQDSTYWGLSEPDVVSAWLALSPATVESGAMRVIPGSHGAQVAHRETYNKENLLSGRRREGGRSGAGAGRNVAASCPVGTRF